MTNSSRSWAARFRTAAFSLLLTAGAVWFPFSAMTAATSLEETVAGVSPSEALRLGERMYREGILPSGKPLQAVVKGDIPSDGNKFTCANCHQRSGFGSMEGTIRTPPVHGAQLYAPLLKFKGIPAGRRRTAPPREEMFRSAYTDESLALALRIGVDPSGRQMNNTMPVYLLDDRDMAIMIHYLKNLSTADEPGVSENEIRFATIITDATSAADRESMLLPLEHYINGRRLSPRMEMGMRTEAYVQEGTARESRKPSLAVWELKGSPSTWRKQLEAYYRAEPVFALLAGIAGGEWEPIHRFCEDHKIPALFPHTDLPVIAGTGGYTFYLSRGLYQEGETAARYLHGGDGLWQGRAVVQVFRNDPSGRALSTSFQETWTGLGHPVPVNYAFDRATPLTADLWSRIQEQHRAAVVILWLDARDFPDLASLVSAETMPAVVLASSTLLGERLYALPEDQRASVHITYPYSLPGEAQVYRTNIEASLKRNNLKLTNASIYYKLYPLFAILSGPLTKMRTYVNREYFMEIIESTPDLSITPILFPRMSFGTGQRYASKGCYVVQLGKGPLPELITRSGWVIH